MAGRLHGESVEVGYEDVGDGGGMVGVYDVIDADEGSGGMVMYWN